MWLSRTRRFGWIFCICLIGVPLAWTCILIAPRMVRPAVEETIVLYSRGPPRIVTLTLRTIGDQAQVIYQDTVHLSPGESRLVRVWIDPEKLVAAGTSLDESTYVSMVVDCGQVYTKEARIPISRESGYLLLQSDKPIYTPKQKVHLRIISVGEDLRPTTADLKLQIKNPQNVTTYQTVMRTNDTATATGMFSHSYSFPESPMLGEWKAIVTYDSHVARQSVIAFEVQEYVLPTFSVALTVPGVILPGTAFVEIRVDAEYLYGRKVAGSATCQIKIGYQAGQERLIGSTETKQLLAGSATFNVPTSEVDPSVFLGARLVVEATVLDRETTERVAAVDDSTVFAPSPYVVGFSSTRQSYLPGVTKMVTVDIRHVDGKPAAGVPCAISAESDEGSPLALIQSSSATDALGMLDFHVFANTQSTGFTVKVRTLLPVETRHQAQGRVHIPALNYALDAYCILQPLNGRKLFKVGETFVAQVLAQPGDTPVQYLVTHNGRIIHHGILRKQYLFADLPPLNILVTTDMAPIFRVLAFTFHRGRVYADSIAVEVEPVCTEASNIEIKPVFNSELPGSNGSIKVLGVSGTQVGILGVDKGIYTLSSKGLLTRDKLFESLRSHDMGCGPGGGETPEEVLSEFGVVIITQEAADLVTGKAGGCELRSHHRRSVLENFLAGNSSDPFLGKCCSLGLKPDRANRDCITRSQIVRRYIPGERGAGCADAFEECCSSLIPQPSALGQDFGLAGRQGVHAVPLPFSTGHRLQPGKIFKRVDDRNGATLIRKDFRETWLFSEQVIGPDGVADFAVSLPHSITTWSVQAVSVSPAGGVCVPSAEEVRSFQPMFLQVALPYKVVRNEQIQVLATVYNYGSQTLQGVVHIYGVHGLCTGAQKGERSEGRNVMVGANSAFSVTFPVVPLREGTFVIKVIVLSSQGVDIVEKELNVVAEGVPVEKRVSVPIDPSNAARIGTLRAMADIYEEAIDPVTKQQIISVNTLLPPDAVPGTKSCSLAVTGNRMRPPVQETLEQVETLLMMPAGNGEHNALLMAQALCTLDYLTRSNLTDKNLKKKSHGLLSEAYQRQLSFRNVNGSFSTFKGTPGSVWLTAFTTRTMCEASRYASVDDEVVKMGLAWLISKLQVNGTLHHDWPLVDKSIQRIADRAVSKTAFLGRTFEECRHVVAPEDIDISFWKSLSPRDVHANVSSLESINPHGAVLLAYAILKTESEKCNPISAIIKRKLLHDPAHSTRSTGNEPSPLVTESTAHALLVLLACNDSDTETIQTLANWLELHRLSSDTPTHHSVVALEALTEFALKYQQHDMDLTCNVSHSGKRSFQKSIRIKRDNAALLQQLDVQDVTGKLLVTANGTGSGLLSVRLKYNVLLPPELACRFNVSVRAAIHTPEEKSANSLDFPEQLVLELLGENRARRSARYNWSSQGSRGSTAPHNTSSQQSKLIYDVEVCAQYLSESDSNMAVIEVGLLSGFVPIADDLETAKVKNQLLANYVVTEKNVMLYFHWIPWRNATCLKFRTERQHVVYNVQSALVKVYDSDDPTHTCTQFYGPDSTSPLLKLTCDADECRCVEDECPPKEPFRAIDSAGGTSAQRRTLLSLACQEHDFVWIGTVTKNHVNSGYRQIELRIDTVLKEGTENSNSVLTGTKLFVAHKYCTAADMSEGSRYFVFGRDGEIFEKNGEATTRYILDKHVRLFDTNQPETSQSASRISSVLRWLTSHLQRLGGCPQ